MNEIIGHQPNAAAAALLTPGERLQAMIDSAEDCAIITLDPAGRVADWNHGAHRLLGWTAIEIIGQPAAVFLPSDPGENPTRQSADCRRKDGSRFSARITVNPIRADNGRLRAHTVVIQDLRVSIAADRPWLTTVVESAMDAIVTVDADQRIILFNKAAEALFLCSADEVLGDKLERFIPHNLREEHARHIEAFGGTGVTSRAMGQLGALTAVRANGRECPIEASISQTQLDGQRYYTVILRDITQRQRAEERQSLLLLELAHRVKNSLAIVQSIIAQTRRYAQPSLFHEALSGRLVALGNAHDLLTHSDWAGATLDEVIQRALVPYAASDRWSVNGPSIWLAANEAVTFSLIFHELASNAARHGALSTDLGTTTISWKVTVSEPKALAVTWCEQDGPLVTPPTRRGFGSRLLQDALFHEMAGESTLSFHETGLECSLRLPLSPKVKALR
jgi:PAS domain S-box-containing protein